MSTYHVNNLEETNALAKRLAKTLQAGDVIAYRGDLGAGKTTFTRGLAEGLGITAHVASPTFAIINEYPGNPLSLYHFDMYRVHNFDSLESTGYFDYLETDSVLAIEWSENIWDELPEHKIVVSLKTVENEPDHRIIEIEGSNL